MPKKQTNKIKTKESVLNHKEEIKTKVWRHGFHVQFFDLLHNFSAWFHYP